MPTIGFFVDRVSFGGGERILMMLIESFKRLNYIVNLYTYSNEWLKFKDNRIRVFELKEKPVGKYKLRSFIELNRKLKQTCPDALICFILGYAEVAIWAAKLQKIPFIVSERCDPKELPTSKFHRVMRNIVFSLSDGIVFQTEEVKRYFSNRIQKHSIVIPNPVIDDNLPLNEQKKVRCHKIVSSGRLSSQKNFRMLIEAFAKSQTKDYILTIYGEGPSREELEKLIKDLQVSDKVRLPGKVDKVVNFISNAEIFVMPSNHEGMPNSLIEGMAMGLACISTDFFSGGARTLIKSGHNGILIPVGDTNALTKALDDLIADDALRTKLQTNAIKIRQTNSKDTIIPIWTSFIMSKISN